MTYRPIAHLKQDYVFANLVMVGLCASVFGLAAWYIRGLPWYLLILCCLVQVAALMIGVDYWQTTKRRLTHRRRAP